MYLCFGIVFIAVFYHFLPSFYGDNLSFAGKMFGCFSTIEEAYEDQNLKFLQRMHLMNFEFHVTL